MNPFPGLLNRVRLGDTLALLIFFYLMIWCLAVLTLLYLLLWS